MSMTFSINEEKATRIVSKVTKLLCNDALKINLSFSYRFKYFPFPSNPTLKITLQRIRQNISFEKVRQ